jgi:hypothetical protein
LLPLAGGFLYFLKFGANPNMPINPKKIIPIIKIICADVAI